MTGSDRALPGDAFPAIVAHRGAPLSHPENTLPSFDAAIGFGAPIVELDVRLSADGVAVVMHDPTVDRTTDGSGAVHELTSAQLARLNAGSTDAPASVPTLAEVLDLVSGRAAVALEIKNLPGEPGYEPIHQGAVETALAELERTAFHGPVLVISFNPACVAACREIAPEVPTGFLTTQLVDPREALSYAVSAGHEMLLPGTRALDPVGEAFVAEAHAAGLRVGTWTADEPDEVARMLDWGVDAVASNDPAMALAILDARRA
ncbi:MAG TPA: glycerophosphodiester phosphodiesterase [Actinomycetota bacterium]|nr:glycerophosphodiester phosphodiesterase [Actinomycetota bacterium]